MLSYLFSKVFGMSSPRHAKAIATSSLPPSSIVIPPSSARPLRCALRKTSAYSTGYSESVSLPPKCMPKPTEYSDLVHSTPPCFSIPTKVENANYADTFDSRIITTMSAVSGRKQGENEKKRKWEKSVHFDLSANTLHKYDWSTLGHDDFPETLTEREKYASMAKYKDDICRTLPKEEHPYWKGYVGKIEYAFLCRKEEMENAKKQKQVVDLAHSFQGSSASMLTTCSVLLVICFLNLQ
ncbi:hypothetical protein L873DRAFT_1811176 [Choiromyces venosus 120613-1]|uniref:Uncharacterized protein n=1 Tax=Choiromyces venosus 120613-1 TaxID=1336337 RepID=A0A3N4JE67_9PEZI|nr:hypothetical protein L873DRAFT_1811176 [Choiromyces venosus 120613-1]